MAMEEHGSDCVKLSEWLCARLPIDANAKQPLLESHDPLFRFLSVNIQLGKMIEAYSKKNNEDP